MDMYSSAQLELIESTKARFLAAGLDISAFFNVPLSSTGASTSTSHNSDSTPLHPISPSPLGVVHSRGSSPILLTAPPIRKDSSVIDLYINRILKTLDYLLDYPLGAIEEYPKSSVSHTGAVGHRFTIDPHNLYHPKFNIQYSLGGKHGAVNDVYCGTLLVNDEGIPVLCKKLFISCNGLKVCEHYTEQAVSQSDYTPTAERILFEKTFALFCVIQERGCSFERTDLLEYAGDSDNDSDDGEKDISPILTRRGRIRRLANTCSGEMILSLSKLNQLRLECQFRSSDNKAHLVLRNLQEFDLEYLKALVSNDTVRIYEHETRALRNGYGPLAGCSFMASPSQQQDLCPFWHRSSSGTLQRGALRHLPSICEATFDIYTPNDLPSCPQVVIITHGTHSHPPPLRIKTPAPILDTFKTMLNSLGWKLADATPRKIMLESGFTTLLKGHLGWKSSLDPPLSALHPSLGNFDHVRRIINNVRVEKYPKGTGFEGAKRMAEEHLKLPQEDQYLRCAEVHKIEKGVNFQLVLCMSRAMAFSLMEAQYISIDTSFKHVHGGYMELELETWDERAMKSVVCVRAFLTQLTAKAHEITLIRIFHFAEKITGMPVRFRHIHGTGFSVWIADAHKGQALGKLL